MLTQIRRWKASSKMYWLKSNASNDAKWVSPAIVKKSARDGGSPVVCQDIYRVTEKNGN